MADTAATSTPPSPVDHHASAVTTTGPTFMDLNLPEPVWKGLITKLDHRKPTKLQEIMLPSILNPLFKDIRAFSEIRSGKSTCLLIGVLCRVDPKLRQPQVLYICANRELAIQNMNRLQEMKTFTGITAECAVPCTRDIQCPSNTYGDRVSPQIVIGTPGTIKAWMSIKKLDVTFMKVIVFDEVDHICAEDDCQKDSLRIVMETRKVRPNCQAILFVHKLNPRVDEICKKVLRENFSEHRVQEDNPFWVGIKPYQVHCPDERTKIEVIKTKILDLGTSIGQMIIFVRSLQSAKLLHKQLSDDDYIVGSIHAAWTTEDRDKIIQEFKCGDVKILLSTDLLARGFDVQMVNCVVNYDLPVKSPTAPAEPDYEVYKHRYCRAGSFRRKGAVFHLIGDDDEKLMMEQIEQYFGGKVPLLLNTEDAFEGALREARCLHSETGDLH